MPQLDPQKQALIIQPKFEDVYAAYDGLKKRHADMEEVARRMGVSVRDVGKAYSQAERDARKAATGGQSQWTQALEANTAAQKSNTNATTDLRKGLTSSAESLEKVASAANLVNPALGDTIRLLQVGAKGASVVSGALGPVAIALGVATAAYGYYRDATEEAEKAEKEAREENDRHREALDRLSDSLKAARQKQLELNGTWDATKVKTVQAADAIRDDYEPEIEALRVKALAAENALREFHGTIVDMDMASGFQKKRLKELGDEVKTTEKAYRDLLAQREDELVLTESNIVVEAQQTEQKKSEAEATRDQARASKERAKAEEEAQREVSRARISAMVDEEERRQQVRREQSQELANVQAGWEAAGDARERAILGDIEGTKQVLALYAKQRQAAADLADAVGGALSDAFGYASEQQVDLVSDLQEAYDEAVENGNTKQAKALKTQIDAAKKGALAAFQAQKATAIAQAIVSGIQGVAVAAASAPPPANLIPIGIATATGAAQVAAAQAVPPPEFDDTPEPVYAKTGRPARGRATVSLAEDDILVAGRTMGSIVAQAIGALNTGGTIRPPRPAAEVANVFALGRTLTHDVRRLTRNAVL